MLLSTSLLVLATSALATPSGLDSRQTNIPAGWTWSVENWQAGCDQSGCSYKFNVTFPSIQDLIDGTKAYCSGGETNNMFSDCQFLEGFENHVSAKLLNRVNGGSGAGPQQFAISVRKAAIKVPTYNYTALNSTTYNAAVLNFNMTPTTAVGVS